MGSRTGRVFINLRPDAFGRIEFRRTDGKLVHMQTRMTSQKILNLPATMNRMPIPHQHDRPCDVSKQVFEKNHDFVSRERVTIGVKVQLDLALPRTHAQGPYQVYPLMVVNARPDGRRLAARRPGPFERRDQRKPTFINKDKGCAQGLPLFLYAARYSVSNAQLLRHRAATCAVAVFGYSTPDVAGDTRRRSDDSARQTTPRSTARCDPTSSNLRRSRTPTPRARGPVPNAGAGSPSSGRDVPVHVPRACVGAVWMHAASVGHSGLLRRSVGPLAEGSSHVAASLGHAGDDAPVVRSFHMVSCALLSHIMIDLGGH
jgi:hypothetical protein